MTHKDSLGDEPTLLQKKRNRKRSWVGDEDTMPYAYLREAMVSNLMGGICDPHSIGEEVDSG